MLFNKNEVRKASEKKVLHKSGKNWITISSALLLALAGGAIATSQTSASADNNNQSSVQQSQQDFLNNVDNNSTINTNNNATIHSLVGNDLVNAPASSAASSKASSKAASSSASSQWYWKWNGGSAQSYKANASSDANIASNESKIVNSYVKSVNAQFPSETSSLNASLGNAKSVLNNDKSLAASYSAIANNSNYSSEINSLAASAGMTSSAYIQSVEYRASNYTSAVQSDSVLSSEMTSVNSYADILDSIADGDTAVKNEYSNAATSANTSAVQASLVYSNAVNALNAYNSNSNSYRDLTLAEQTALNDSVEDAGTVQSIATEMGIPSASVSSEVRTLAVNNSLSRWDAANSAGLQNAWIVSGNNSAQNSYGKASVASFAAGHAMPVIKSGSYDGSGTDIVTFMTIGGLGAYNNRVPFTKANGTTGYVNDYDPALVRVVSNTAVMYNYDNDKAAYGKNAKYASAQSAVNSASVAYNDAETKANYYDILSDAAATNNADAALNYIFGTNGADKSLMDSSVDHGTNAGSDAAAHLLTTVSHHATDHTHYFNEKISAGDLNAFFEALGGAVPANANTEVGMNVQSAANQIGGTAGSLASVASAAQGADAAGATRSEVASDLNEDYRVLGDLLGVNHNLGAANMNGVVTGTAASATDSNAAGSYFDTTATPAANTLYSADSSAYSQDTTVAKNLLDDGTFTALFTSMPDTATLTYNDVQGALYKFQKLVGTLKDAVNNDTTDVTPVTANDNVHNSIDFVNAVASHFSNKKNMVYDLLGNPTAGSPIGFAAATGTQVDRSANLVNALSNLKNNTLNYSGSKSALYNELSNISRALGEGISQLTYNDSTALGDNNAIYNKFNVSTVKNGHPHDLDILDAIAGGGSGTSHAVAAINGGALSYVATNYNLDGVLLGCGTTTPSTYGDLRADMVNAQSFINQLKAVVGSTNTGIFGVEGANPSESYTYGSLTGSEISSLNSSVASDYTTQSNASVAYSRTTDANIALAPYYAASYAGDIKPDEAAVSAASSAQNDFYVAHAGSSYASAAYEASSASAANVNDEALAQAYGINVYNNTPKYIRAIKGVRVHSDTNFGSKADKVMGTIPAGDEMTVEGIGLDAHGALRYNIYYKGANYFVSGNANYVTPTFLAAENNVSIVLNKPAKEYKDANFTKYAGKTLNANAQVSGDIVRMDNFNDGFTRVHLSNGNYITANTNYVAKVANNDDAQNNINGQNINHYISNANNDNNNNDAPITWGI